MSSEVSSKVPRAVSLAGLFLCSLGAGALLGPACTTPQPDERFAPADISPAGPGAGGAGPGSGGSGRTPSSGGVGASAGGSSAGAGGAGGTAGSAPVSECGPAPAPALSGEFTRRALREAAADCVLWNLCETEFALDQLQGAVSENEAVGGDAALAAAREAWDRAMDTWSRLELMQFGPTASASVGAGKDVYQGQGYRDRIHSWPLSSRCRVDEQVAGLGFAEFGMESVLVSGRGLCALEYLLFYPDNDTGCVTGSATQKSWAKLTGEQIVANKSRYRAALAEDLPQVVGALRAAWSPEAENFRAKFAAAEGYPDEQEAMNVLAWALVYLEKEIKDWKLGIPAGYTLTSPVSEQESRYAARTTRNVRANLLGFRSLFQGCGEAGAGIGFDDWLVAAGHGGLADDIVAAWESARSTLDATPELHEASAAEIEAAYRAIKAVTDLLKADLFGAGSPLNLKLPAGVEGDTD